MVENFVKSMHSNKRYVIIGNGGAAFHCIKSIREIDQNNDVIIISEENSPAYSPVLLPYYLEGSLSLNDIYLCNQDFYRENNIKIINNRAVGIDIKDGKVFLQKNGSISYDVLLIATGSIADISRIEGGSLPGVFTILRKDDAEKILAFLRRSEKIAIVGAGLIGMHTLEALLNMGKEVILTEALPHILPHVIDKESAEVLQNWLRAKGVEIYLERKLIAIEEGSRRKILHFTPDLSIDVDMVILATGVRANKDFLEGSGIHINEGIVVDEYSRTIVEDVYAAGDVAESKDAITGVSQIRATWINAVDQGRIAGLNMAGLNIPNSRRLKMNISSTLGIPFATIGEIKSEGGFLREMIVRDDKIYRKYVFDEEGIAGAVLLGDIEDAGVIASMIERRNLYRDVEEGLKEGNGFHPWSKQFMI
jgi:NAD(P)H-nitrite reductase large subunit